MFRRVLAPTSLAATALAVSLATILAALAFEHIGGYEPCALCLKERIPYYLGIPLIVAALGALAFRAPPIVGMLLLGLFAATMTYGAGLGVYHAGAEWGFWPGPATCGDTGSGVTSAGGLADALKAPTIGPSCTEAVWRLFGLSFAGWNAVIAAGLALLGGLSAIQLAIRGPASPPRAGEPA